MRLDEAAREGQQAEGSADLPPVAVWQSRRAGVFSALRLALLRAAHSRWLLLGVALGILVADILICTVPLYITLISDVQLQNTMSASAPVERNMQVAVRTGAISRDVQQQVNTEIQGDERRYLGGFTAPTPTTYLSGDVMALLQAGPPSAGLLSANTEARMEAFDYSALRPYLRFTAGVAPADTAPGKPIQVMVTQDMVDLLHAAVGQTIVVGNLGGGQKVTGIITGVFVAKNPDDPFWNGHHFDIEGGQTIPAVYPVLTTTGNFYAAFSAFDGVGMTQTWVYYTESNRITTSNMGDVASGVQDFRSHVIGNLQSRPAVANVVPLGSLDQIIASVQTQLGLIALPLYVIAAQIVGLALLFVAAMATLLIESQRQQIATLKSRGLSGVQLLGVFSLQSGLLGLLAALAGPLLAVVLALALIHLFLPTATMTGGLAALSANVAPGAVILPAVGGALVGVGVVTLSALAAARQDVLAFRRESARPARPPFWQRAYLDVALALVCALGYLELGQFGGAQQRLALGSQQSNSPLLLVTPALLLLAGGLLLLRLVPLLARAGAGLARRGRGLTALLAWAQVARTPGRYARLTLLLALAVGLGLFALTFDASLTQNVGDRTAYAVGADVRLQLTTQVATTKTSAYLAHLTTLPGVAEATPLYRTYGSTSVDLGNLSVDVLGVDATSFAGVATARSWRADYADQSLPRLMAQLRAHRTPTAVAADTALHPLWAIVSASFAEQLRLKVGDRFQLSLSDTPFSTPSFVVGAIIQEFPTLYPQQAPGGFMVVDLTNLDALIKATAGPGVIVGSNEFWLRASGDTGQQSALMRELTRQQYALFLNGIESYQQDLAQAQANPINGGMRGLLLVGAFTAALLAILGALTQAVVAARQRATQFAILRTLGMASRQLSGLLLGEQAVVYLLGLVGGTLLGLALTTATFPYLIFSDAAVDPTTLGVPSYVLRVDWARVGLFYGALLLAFALALALAARYAATLGLGKTLRLGED